MLRKTVRLVFVMLVIAVLLAPGLAHVSMVAAQDGTSAFTYAEFGPYWVGRQEVVLDEDTETELKITIWYPALNPDAEGEEPNPDAITLRDAEIDREQAPYPLVIFSHGLKFNTNSYSSVCKHLVSHGFVVITPNHVGDQNIAGGPEGDSERIVRRLLEVKQVIAHADQLTNEEGMFAGIIDSEKIAVMGHSAGGMTAYGAGGASIDLASFDAYCAQTPEYPDCQNWTGNVVAMLEAAGLEESPEHLWPPIWDSRVDAIIPLAGTFELYGQAGLATSTVPALIMYGSLDSGSLTDWMPSAYDYIGSSQKIRVILETVGHEISNDQLSRDPHTAVMHFSTAFLLTLLKGDAEAGAALAPDAVAFPGITYEAEGF